MTGYGSAAATKLGYEARVEVRVVNHRQIDVRVRGYGLSSQTQATIDAMCRERLSRGRVEINVQVSQLERSAEDVIDTDHARVVWKALRELSDELGSPPPTLDTLLRVPGLLVASASDESQRSQSAAIEAALDKALSVTCSMRQTEGAALERDMRSRLATLRAGLNAIESAAPTMTEHFRDTLTRRVQSLAPEGQDLDPERLEREVVLFAARADITEETVRLQSHLAQLKSLFSEGEPVGKRIDFLLQEISREVNTIASKVSDASIAQTVVEMKSEVARLREQALNIL